MGIERDVIDGGICGTRGRGQSEGHQCYGCKGIGV